MEYFYDDRVDDVVTTQMLEEEYEENEYEEEFGSFEAWFDSIWDRLDEITKREYDRFVRDRDDPRSESERRSDWEADQYDRYDQIERVTAQSDFYWGDDE